MRTKTLAIRFGFLYCLFEWVTLSVQIGTPVLTGGWLKGPDWWGALNRTVGVWTITSVLGLPEHAPPRLSANSLALILGMGVVAMCSVFAAAAWTALDRRTDDSRLLSWAHTCVRFMLASLMLWYGWHKVLPAQFPFTFDYFTLDLGYHNPNDLLWAFMGASRPYQVFAGLVEVSGGVLLLTRRTSMLGAVVSVGAMANVVALDVAYDVPVKFLAGQMLLMALFTLAPFVGRLARVFLTSRDAGEARLDPLVRNPRTDMRLRTVGMLFALWVVYANFLAAEQQVELRAEDRRTPLYGIWDVEDTSRNGVSVPMLWTDSAMWRRLVVQSNSAAIIIPMSKTPLPDTPNSLRFRTRLDAANHSVVFTPFPFSDSTEPLTFSYAVSDADHLVLNGRDGRGFDIAVRLRRVDPSTYTLLRWERTWTW